MRFTWVLVCVCVGLTGIFQQDACGDDQLESHFPAPTGDSSKETWNQYQDRLQEIQAGFAAQNRPLPPEFDLEDDGIAYLLDVPEFGNVQVGQNQSRYLIGRLVVINSSKAPVTIPGHEIKLSVDGETYLSKPENENQHYIAYRHKNRQYNISELPRPEKIHAEPGTISSCWIVYPKVVYGISLTPMSLGWTQGDQQTSIDLYAQAQAELRWHDDRIGPGQRVAICKVGGRIHSLTIGVVVDQLVELATQNVLRMVIHFDPKLPETEQYHMQWFQTAASLAGKDVKQNSVRVFPHPPTLIQEMHLVIPENMERSDFNGSSHHLHNKLIDAYLAASKPIYRSTTMKELRNELEHGHPLSQAAALFFGAVRLPQEDWTTVAEFLEPGRDISFRLAATSALQEFSSPEAIQLLADLTRGENDDLALLAMESLANSRFPSQQTKLLELLETNQERKAEIIRTMARHPRRIWANTLYDAAQNGTDELRKEALFALDLSGHPGTVDLLENILENSENEELQQTALMILSKHSEPQSQQIAIDYTLQQLATNYPDTSLLSIVDQFQIHRAIPILIPYLETENPNRSRIIETLRKIGDESVVKALKKVYPDLTSSEQISALRSISEIDEEAFLQFAPQAVKHNPNETISTLIDLVTRASDPRTPEILVKLLAQIKEEETSIKIVLIHALGAISSKPSRDALIKIRDEGPKQERDAAVAALESMLSRSPVNALYQQASRTLAEGRIEEAISQFTIVLRYDPEYPRALNSRALAYQQQDDYDAAIDDYRQLAEIDDRWPGVQGKLGQLLTSLSRFEDSLTHLNLAIKYEPEVAIWYSARGHAYAMLERFEVAEADYRKAIELDPDLLTAFTGVALSLAVRGEIDEAIKMLESRRGKAEDDSIFAYNAACIYSRAAHYLANHSPDSTRIKDLNEAALKELDRSVELGYTDAQWTEADPDLISLRGQARFKKILDTMKTNAEAKAKPEKSEEDASAVPPEVLPDLQDVLP